MNELIQMIPEIKLYRVMMVPIKYLIPSEYNPRTIQDDNLLALKKSIKANPEFFKARPILLNTAKGREGIIIGGDKRYRVALELKMTAVPVMFVLAETLEKEKAWNILDNKAAGEWDRGKLKEVIGDLHESGYNMDTLGHTPDELVGLSSDFNMDDPTETDEYKKNGTTPSTKLFRCPECDYEGNRKDFEKLIKEDQS